MIRSPIRFSPSTGGFYRTDVHGDTIPDDAVSVGAARHAELMATQGARRIIPGPDGKPTLTPVRKIKRLDQLVWTIAAIKAEAGRRILAIASIERQSNDNAALALAAIDGATTPEADASRARRIAIDAVRVASGAIETTAATWSLAALMSFDAASDHRWPQE